MTGETVCSQFIEVFNCSTKGRHYPEHDIALVKLQYPVQFSAQINRICLKENDPSYPPLGKSCVLTGWGDDEHGQSRKYSLNGIMVACE